MLLLTLACSQVQLATTPYDPRPQTPRVLRDVATVDDQVQNPEPYVPGHRTTMDGRVALRVQGGTADIERLSTKLSFFLFAPEKLEEPILQGPAGPVILADPEPFDVEFPPALDPEMFRLGHHAICDPTTEFPEPDERPNPYACGEAGLDDCYDLHVISSTSPGFGAQLWGTPVTVVVSDPKTVDARIADIELGEPVQGAWIEASTEWTEPAVTSDGRLMTGRLGRFPRAWTNPQTGETLNRYYDLAYSVLPDDAEPCDITGWTDFHPMSHAPYDPDMEGYGLAAYPFRDTEGTLIPDGEDLGGTYPWVDREGANLFMTGVPGRISEQSQTRYPRSCVHAGCDELEENVDFDRGFQVAGLWTHGKFVHLDSRINHLDWAVGVSPEAHWNVELYVDENGEPVPVRVGGGRFVEAYRETGPYPDGYTHNANVLDSLQNVANFWPAARPITPRDVVWVMSSGVATDEVVFDDLLDPNTLIVSNMQATVTQLWDDGASTSVPYHHNGQVRTSNGLGGVLNVLELEPEDDEPIHLQNGATSLVWEVPSYGWIEAGSARVEPVALGGVSGRGLWLSGDAAVVYALPEQPAVNEEPGYIGLFVDPRADAGELRELLRFGDGTGVVLDSTGAVVYVREGREVHTVPIEPVDGWVHLGWRIDAGHRTVTLLVDGFPQDRFEVPRRQDPLFSFSGGELVVGRHTEAWTGFRGWIDEFVVLLHDVDPEVACNHAMGTLVAVEDDGPWSRVADAQPDWAHAEVADAAGTGERFACWQDHTTDHAIDPASPPDGTRSVRTAIVFPEGPLRAGAPRPDSSDNAFCLTCHTDEGVDSLHTDALVAEPSLLLEDDPRRQPSQPPRRVFGNIPAGWIPPGDGPGSPSEPTLAPPEGALIDHWVLPRAED